MTTRAWPAYSPFAREHYGRGRADGIEDGIREGGSRMLLRQLALRGIDVPDDVRARISACTDPEQFETWAGRTVGARSVQDLFREE